MRSARWSAALVPDARKGSKSRLSLVSVLGPGERMFSSSHWCRVTPKSASARSNCSSTRRSTSLSQNPSGLAVVCRDPTTAPACGAAMRTAYPRRGVSERGSVGESQLLRVLAESRELRRSALQVRQCEAQRPGAEAHARDAEFGEALQRHGCRIRDHRHLAVDLVQGSLHLVLGAESEDE